ncbi:hypothetical protein CYMTET_10825 [Cymbomonas tetramitiformis]|uniref:Nuclease associated modular domain-containing protein n=1 Tax=Cymbomonas tetramitiformis TaxID=36881 RepID=A0AAE0GNV0_9CHLO|nr:hypothetical protein CYMTET_10825 [Cymbomonas tetramitiformis]
MVLRSKANSGRVPWNKGRKHNKATIEKIRQKTKEAMARKEVQEKIQRSVRPKHTAATKAKIRKSVLDYNQKQLEKRRSQAKAAKAKADATKERLAEGFQDQGKLAAEAQALLDKEALEEKEKKAELKKAKAAKKRSSAAAKPKAKAASSRTHKSEEHRRNIAEAIKAKWRDPEYRRRVEDGREKKAAQEGSVKKPRPRTRPTSAAKSREEQEARHQLEERTKLRDQLRNKASLLLAQAERAAIAMEAKAASGNAEDIAAAARARETVESVRASVNASMPPDAQPVARAAAPAVTVPPAPVQPAAASPKGKMTPRAKGTSRAVPAPRDVRSGRQPRLGTRTPTAITSSVDVEPADSASGAVSMKTAVDASEAPPTPCESTGIPEPTAAVPESAPGAPDKKVVQVWQRGRLVEIVED